MIKLFYATGDSFAHGQELGTVKFNIVETPDTLWMFSDYKRQHCYTGILCDRKTIPNYMNSACPGGSIERSYRVLITDISEQLTKYKPEEIFVNLSLTADARREFPMDDNGNYYIHLDAWEPPKEPNPQNHMMWSMLTKHFNFDHGHYTFSMMMILGIQNFLRTNRIPYLITSSMGNNYQQNSDPHQQHLSNKYVPESLCSQLYIKRFHAHPSFMGYCMEKKIELGPQLHPMEEGHVAWADYLQKYIEENNLWSNEDL